MENLATTLRTLLAHNIVSFTFRKVNGEIRQARGTRNLQLARNHTDTYIPKPKGAEQPNSYYDVEKMGWRSYKPENLISIDGIDFGVATIPMAHNGHMPKNPDTETKKGELPKREIPISKPMGGGADIDKFGLGGLFGGTYPKEEIHKSMEELGRDIDIVPPTASFGGAKVGTPIFTDKGLELETGVAVEDFAKMVAHYVVEELVSRITR